MPTFPHISDDDRRRLLEPPSGPIRLIIDTDAHNEIDDQFAIAWALLSQDVFQIEGALAEPYTQRHNRQPLIDVVALLRRDPHATLPAHLQRYRHSAANMIASDIDPAAIRFVDPDEGMELSYQEIIKIYDLLDEPWQGSVFRGSPGYLESLDKPIDSPAARRIIERALAGDDRPLYVSAIGCLTNVASAILMEPDIIRRIVVLWTSTYPSFVNLNHAPSLNLVQDIPSSQLIYDCGVPLVFLPGYYIGEQLKLSLPDMEAWVRGKGRIGDYLYHLYTHNPIHPMQGIADHFGRSWVCWDLINFAWLLNPDWVPSQLVPTPILTDDLYWAHAPHRPLMREAHGIYRDDIYRDFFIKLEQAP